jgi:hypothetical protein
MLTVTFKAEYPIKEGRKWVKKASVWTEQIKDAESAKLRAMALNWQIVKIEAAKNA